MPLDRYLVYQNTLERRNERSLNRFPSLPADISAKDIRLDPIDQHKRAVTSAEAHVDVR